MKTRFSDKKAIYRLREYAILEDNTGTYEYMKWDPDPKTKKISWVRGEARQIEDILALTSIVSEGKEKKFKTMKEVRKALKKLPDWWNKTKYYCVLLGGQAWLTNHCISGKPLEEDSEETARVESVLKKYGFVLVPRKGPESST